MNNPLKMMLSIVAISAFGWSTDISTWKSNYASGADVWIEIEDKPNNIQDWVGIYPKNASNDWNNVIDWRWANETSLTEVDAGDWYKFKLDDGDYEARFFLNNTFDVKNSIVFTVGEVIPEKKKISMSQDNYNSNENISVILSDELSGDRDWVGIYPKESSNTWNNVVAWSWVKKGSNSLPNIPSGEYEARLFFHNSFDIESKVLFTVGDDEALPQTEIIGARATDATPVNQGKLFASPTGNGNCMSYENPCNLTTAISKLSKKNNVLFLKEGDYSINELLIIPNYLSGTADKPIIIESYPTTHATLIGNATIEKIKAHKSPKGGIYIGGGETLRHIKIRNIEITKMGGKGITLMRTGGITIEGCNIHHNYLSGIGLFRSSDNIIIDNKLHNNSDKGLTDMGNSLHFDNGGNADGVAIDYEGYSNRNIISHNNVYTNSDDGIDNIGGVDSIITYNMIYNNLGLAGGENGGTGNGIGIKACGKNSKRTKVKHNIAFSNHGNGFECNKNNGEGVVFKYNTSYANGKNKRYGFEINKNNSYVNLTMNISSNNGKGNRLLGGIGENNSWAIANNIQFISTRFDSKDFLKPKVGSVFENMGAYAKLPVMNNKQVKIFVIGDSTTFNKDILDGHGGYHEMGWAQKEALGSYMRNKSNLFDEGRSGASSKTYKTIIDNLHDWQETKDLIKNTDISDGAYLLIQFGHNDEKGEGYTTPNEFYTQLEEYVDWAKLNDITPILITPVERRAKSKGNLNHKTHEEAGGYAQKVRDLAEAKSITMLDLQNKSWNEYNTYEDMNAINTVLAYDDNTHFSPKGAKIVAGWIKELLCESGEEVLCNQFR